jgi:hypothetical protein
MTFLLGGALYSQCNMWISQPALRFWVTVFCHLRGTFVAISVSCISQTNQLFDYFLLARLRRRPLY